MNFTLGSCIFRGYCYVTFVSLRNGIVTQHICVAKWNPTFDSKKHLACGASITPSLDLQMWCYHIASKMISGIVDGYISPWFCPHGPLGRYPQTSPFTPTIRKKFLHKLLVKRPGYLSGVCGWDLRISCAQPILYDQSCTVRGGNPYIVVHEFFGDPSKPYKSLTL